MHVHVHVIGGPEPLGPMIVRKTELEETTMGGLSIWHWLIVLVVVVLIFGTKKLRNIGHGPGRRGQGLQGRHEDAATTGRRSDAAPSRRRRSPARRSKAKSRRNRRTRSERAPGDRLPALARAASRSSAGARRAHRSALTMFDIGFSEIVVIAVVALIVIGPERLPKAARTLGHLFGRLQRYVNDVKADINREMELDELRKLQREVQTAAARPRAVGDARRRSDVEAGVRNVERELNDAARRDAGATAPIAAPPRRWSRRRAAARPAEPPGAATRRDAGVAAGARRASSRCPASTAISDAFRAMSDDARTDAQETFLSHLIELRTRLLRAIVAVVVVLLCLFPWAKEIYALLAQPLLRVLPQGATMIATDVTGTFLVPLKVTLMAAFLIALPYVL